MNKVKTYNLTGKEFKILENLSDTIFNTCVVLDYFCSNQRQIEELYNISPIVANLRNNSDILNSFFINYEQDENLNED